MRKKLGELLIDAGVITHEALEKVLREKNKSQKLGDALLQSELITEKQLIQALEWQLGIPHVDLTAYPINPSILQLISMEVSKRNLVIPLKLEGDHLLVAMADPLDYYTIDDLRLTTGYKIHPAIAAKDDIVRTIHRYYRDEPKEEVAAGSERKGKQRSRRNAPIIQLIDQLLSSAIAMKASDIHIDAQENSVVIRFRVDGLLHREQELPKSIQNELFSRIKIMAELDTTEQRIAQDGRVKIPIDYRTVDIRVSLIPTVHGEKAVLRILDRQERLMQFEHLGFQKEHLMQIRQMIQQPAGIVLITGPTGAGKTSTLYAALHEMNKEEVNIITIEDPVEQILKGINQLQVHKQVGMTFASGLRSILRQDPNIIMIGEIRDQETAQVAIRAALTGHLVLSTLHTNDSVSTVMRLIDMGIEPFLVSSALNGVVAQRLVRKVCLECKETITPTSYEQTVFANKGIELENLQRGRGCSHCQMTGYKGRIALHEVFILNDALRKIITTDHDTTTLKIAAKKAGMRSLLEDGLHKISQGLTTLEEVLKVTMLEEGGSLGNENDRFVNERV